MRRTLLRGRISLSSFVQCTTNEIIRSQDKEGITAFNCVYDEPARLSDRSGCSCISLDAWAWWATIANYNATAFIWLETKMTTGRIVIFLLNRPGWVPHIKGCLLQCCRLADLHYVKYLPSRRDLATWCALSDVRIFQKHCYFGSYSRTLWAWRIWGDVTEVLC